jgi:alkyl hydroperoxide reductase subunit AhpC
MKNTIQIFILILLFNACASDQEKGSAFINGKMPAMVHKWIYLQELEVNKINLLDSVQVDADGYFEINFNVPEPGFYILKTHDDNYVLLFVEPGNHITINASSDLLQEGYEVEGSVDSELLRDFDQFMIGQKRKVDSLAIEFNNSKGLDNFYEKKVELDSAYFEIYTSQREYVINFLETHPSSMVSLIVMNRKLGNNKILDEEEDFIYFHQLDSSLMLQYPNNKHTLDHHKRMEQIRYDKFDRFIADKKLEPGNKAPNIILKDTSGQFISLKDLAGKKVLIYFWAGWNAKSRQDNRQLVSLYPRFKKNNLEIFGVSLDVHEKVWKGAISLDKTPWIQGSDLMGMNSKVVQNYNLLDELPYYFIVDEEGKFIYHSRDLDSISLKMDELF